MERTICRDPVEMNCLCFVIVVITSGRYINNKVVKKIQRKTKDEKRAAILANRGTGGRGKKRQLQTIQSATRLHAYMGFGGVWFFLQLPSMFPHCFFDKVIVLNLEPGNEVQCTESRGLSGTADYLNEIRLDLLGRMAFGS